MLQRLATLAFRRRRTVLAAWLVVIVAALSSYAAFGSNPETAASAVAATVETLPDVLTVNPPHLGNDGTTDVVSVIPRSGPHDNATTTLVKTIRAHAPALASTDGAAVSVTGPTAVGIDVSTRLSSSLLPFAAVVVGLALFLLLIKFRSLVVPIPLPPSPRIQPIPVARSRRLHAVDRSPRERVG